MPCRGVSGAGKTQLGAGREPDDDTLFWFAHRTHEGPWDTSSIQHSHRAHPRCLGVYSGHSGKSWNSVRVVSFSLPRGSRKQNIWCILNMCTQTHTGGESPFILQALSPAVHVIQVRESQAISCFDIQMLLLVTGHPPVLLEHQPPSQHVSSHRPRCLLFTAEVSG